jgi:hypothetical protein
VGRVPRPGQHRQRVEGFPADLPPGHAPTAPLSAVSDPVEECWAASNAGCLSAHAAACRPRGFFRGIWDRQRSRWIRQRQTDKRTRDSCWRPS